MQHIEEITEQNIEIKMNDILRLIRAWSGRNITPRVKITLIKSLLFYKITHILLSLPSPQEDTMKRLDNMFIWNNKPANFRKEKMENTFDQGVLI